MLSAYRKLRDESRFIPRISGLFLNPAYLMRRTLADSIRSAGWLVSGVFLDFGCGAKPYESLFIVDKYIGLDIEVSGHPDECKKADIFYDGKYIPLTDESVDHAFSAEVFEHVFNAPTLFREINRVLKPGGTLILTCPFVWPLHEEPYDFARYTPYALNSLLTEAGFQAVQCHQNGHSVEVVAQLLLLELHRAIPDIPILGGILSVLLCGVVNVSARLLSKILPTDKRLYLSNFVIASKIEKQ